MQSLDEKIESVCWRINTRVTAKAEPGAVMTYIELHSSMLDLANFHRDFFRL